jgi:NitT/TauT family transport system permease protein
MGRAVKGMINAEMFIAVVGLGDLAIKYGLQFNAPNVLAVSMVILCVALIAVRLVYIVEQRLTGWVTKA